MPLSDVQQGAIGEMETAILLMITSDGQLEVARPVSDDERRDEEVHERGKFGAGLALQVKTATYLHWYPDRTSAILQIQFSIAEHRIVNHPLFYYVLASLDLPGLGFRDPLFFVDSTTFHKHAVRSKTPRDGKIYFEFQGSMSPDAHDIWFPSQTLRKDLGSRVLKAIHEAEQVPTASPLSASFTVEPGTIWVARRRLHKVP